MAIVELEHPVCIRRLVCFAEALHVGSVVVEGVRARRVTSVTEIRRALRSRKLIPVLADPVGAPIREISPVVVIDARMAKRNIDTSRSQAPLVVGLGPGFTAGRDVHVVIETNRGHDLGRVITKGHAQTNTGVPGVTAGFTAERVLRAPAEGIFRAARSIGDLVRKGRVLGAVDGFPVRAPLGGLLRGLIHDDIMVSKGMKIGDIDPRGRAVDPQTISDKARAVSGGTLEAILSWGTRHAW